MNENMANFKFKIAEMQRKLNIINDDIEEIKNGRKSQEETETLNNNYTYFQMKRKNFFNTNFIGDDSNFPIQNNQSDLNYLNFKYTGRMTNQLKTTNFNLTNTNLEEIPKNAYITKFDSLNFINNNIESNTNDIESNKNATINYADFNNNLGHKYKTSSSTINVNDKKYFENPFKKNINFTNLEVNDNFYKNSLYQNYCHIKKNLNNINLNTNNFNSSQTLNNNFRGNKTFNKRAKNINSIPSLKHKKIKKIIDKRNVINSTTEKNLFNTEIVQKRQNKNNIKLNNFNNNGRKTIDINYNNKNIYHNNNNINPKSNSPVKIKVKSNNINHANNKADFNKIKDKNNITEDINMKNIRSQRSMSIKNPINNNCKFNRNIHQNFHEISATNIRNNYPNTEIINSKDYLNTSIDKKLNHEQMLLDLIDITNQYNNKDNKVNMDNIIDEYKSLLYDFKLKNEFIYKTVDLYNNSTNSNLKYNDSESLLPTWNWIRDNQNKIANSNILNKNEDNQYKELCEDIMKQYNLKNIQQLKKFIGKLCKKVDKNENFLEGIKKILLP